MIRSSRAMLLASAAALAACSGKSGTTNEVDVANAATSAQNDIDNYAAGADAAAPPADSGGTPSASGDGTGGSVAPSPAPSPAASGSGAVPPASLPAPPFTPDSAQGAANVVQTYYALLEEGRYRQAWRLWDNDGRASGMSADAFAASFAKYRDYHANVGAPGQIEAGAGQRYVTVPVRVYGTLKAGGAKFAMAGPVTLHRVGDIDGATAAQRSWRISASGVRPRPGDVSPAPPPTATPAIVAARYRCEDGTDVVARFEDTADTATLRIGETRVVLRGRHPASGLWYSGEGYDLRGKGRSADLSQPGKPKTACTAR